MSIYELEIKAKELAKEILEGKKNTSFLSERNRKDNIRQNTCRGTT